MLHSNTLSRIDGTRGSEREYRIGSEYNASVYRLFTVGKGRQNSSGLMQMMNYLAGEILVVGKGRP
jgi:hypothetical protein